MAGPGGVPRDTALADAVALLHAGDVTRALAALQARRGDLHLPPLAPLDDALLLAHVIECRVARGDLAEAMQLGDELTPYADRPGAPGGFAHAAKGELAAVLGDPELAVEHFTRAGQRLDEAGGTGECVPVELLLPWRASAVVALVRTGDTRLAAELAALWLGEAVATGSPYAHAHALRTLATVGSGDRVQQLREARCILGTTTAERLAAQVDTDLAGLLLLAADSTSRDEAVGLLRSAEQYAGRQELWPLQGRVRRLLDRVGEAPRRLKSEALAALTASERRVAQLAADGLTNRQIAESLEVTVKAVEWHLSHVYRKLGLSSRAYLASTLGVGV